MNPPTRQVEMNSKCQASLLDGRRLGLGDLVQLLVRRCYALNQLRLFTFPLLVLQGKVTMRAEEKLDERHPPPGVLNFTAPLGLFVTGRGIHNATFPASPGNRI
jgi:hypothetical protein